MFMANNLDDPLKIGHINHKSLYPNVSQVIYDNGDESRRSSNSAWHQIIPGSLIAIINSGNKEIGDIYLVASIVTAAAIHKGTHLFDNQVLTGYPVATCPDKRKYNKVIQSQGINNIKGLQHKNSGFVIGTWMVDLENGLDKVSVKILRGVSPELDALRKLIGQEVTIGQLKKLWRFCLIKIRPSILILMNGQFDLAVISLVPTLCVGVSFGRSVS